ncbi:MAG: 3-isopropylmalate dehydratase large subunit [Oscillospiraceae bacterium]|jgi:3-isopropylmalate/(R)-2-methylmalate dehydratase large subunit|nr:3-isopropylmalate dehydratase large subunit [Oscillospiraceae bacterium]
MTKTQKILARHAGLESVVPGQLIKARLDLVMGNDITAPVAISEMEKAGLDTVFDPDKIVLVMDHFTPCKDIKSAGLCTQVRKFAKTHGINNVFDVGEMGIEHVLLPEKGFTAPGEVIIGADSHTCTYGALGAFSTGVGSTDMAAGMATGLAWFKVPSAIAVRLKGRLRPGVSGKDVILHLIGLLGVDGARYQSLEFLNAEALSMDDRFTIANMAIECGAKNGIFPVDTLTLEYLKGRITRDFTDDAFGDEADYGRIVEIDLDALEPTVSKPFSPDNTALAKDLGDIKIQQVVIGSCTNGRISDLRIAADILRGRHVAKGVRCIVIPGSQDVYLQALREGLAEVFISAGCALSTPTCGPCLGGHMGILDAGERCVSTTNRNFVGRMGHTGSEVYLASPAVAAASALTGRITAPEETAQMEREGA